jgi:CheY-specific phosphatase CheX
MYEEICPTAISLASKLFERMFFLPLKPRRKQQLYPPLYKSPIVYKGEIGFHGKNSGRLKLYLPCDLADIMVQNFLDLDEGEMKESQTIDMINELCNIICGNLFLQLDQKAAWDLTLPFTKFVPPQEVEKEPTPKSVAIDLVAKGLFGVKLVIEFMN